MTQVAAYKIKNNFEEHYLSLRKKEGRIYTDGEVLKLPVIDKSHPHFSEWCIRKKSAKKLRLYFEKKKSLLKILEVGCGNGWLSHQLAYIPGSDITATDINFMELQQAARVFSHVPNLEFIYGGIHAKEVESLQYDFIVFASSIQYFSSLTDIIELARHKLKPAGEIHILDSPFYKQEEIELAKKRTSEYYQQAGSTEMTGLYHHHSLDTFRKYKARLLYAPSFFNRYLLNQNNPFPWICIRK